MATLEFFARNSTPATADLAATMAPALTSDRGAKDATLHAPVNQVCVCPTCSYFRASDTAVLSDAAGISEVLFCNLCCGIIRVLLRVLTWLRS